jgi:hypothetical protein
MRMTMKLGNQRDELTLSWDENGGGQAILLLETTAPGRTKGAPDESRAVGASLTYQEADVLGHALISSAKRGHGR